MRAARIAECAGCRVHIVVTSAHCSCQTTLEQSQPATHSPAFVAMWRSVFCDVYRWPQEGRFAVVPSLVGAPVLAYLPGLNYTDLSTGEAHDLSEQMTGRSYNIRALTATQGTLRPGAPAVLRIDLAALDHDVDAVWHRALKRSARKSVRRAGKAGLRAVEETGPAAVATFASLVKTTLARHGAPMPPRRLVDALIDALGGRLLVVRAQPSGEARASLLWFRDGPLAWAPWGGFTFGADSPGNLLFWAAIAQATRDGADIFDFGRSAVGGGPYRFKRSFGAAPTPVLWLSDKPADMYRRYATAQRLWRLCPATVTDRLGPRLCRYLADY